MNNTFTVGLLFILCSMFSFTSQGQTVYVSTKGEDTLRTIPKSPERPSLTMQNVPANSMADKSGLINGGLIQAINGIRIKTIQDLDTFLKGRTPEDKEQKCLSIKRCLH